LFNKIQKITSCKDSYLLVCLRRSNDYLSTQSRFPVWKKKRRRGRQ